MVGKNFIYLGKCGGKSRFGDVCHEDFCTFARKENGGLKAYATNPDGDSISNERQRAGKWIHSNINDEQEKEKTERWHVSSSKR